MSVKKNMDNYLLMFVVVVLGILVSEFLVEKIKSVNDEKPAPVAPVNPTPLPPPKPIPRPIEKIVILDFMAEWCQPCKEMKKVWNDSEVQDFLTKNNYELEFVDVDKQPVKRRLYEVESVPTIVLFRHRVTKNDEIKRHVGYMGKQQLLNFLSSDIGGVE